MTETTATHTNNTPASDAAWCVYSPEVDIYENDVELMLIAEVPGATTDGLSVDFADSVLSIAAELPQTTEYKTSYRRQFKLTTPIDPDKISAELKAGELTIRLGKSDSHRPKRIDVKAS